MALALIGRPPRSGGTFGVRLAPHAVDQSVPYSAPLKNGFQAIGAPDLTSKRIRRDPGCLDADAAKVRGRVVSSRCLAVITRHLTLRKADIIDLTDACNPVSGKAFAAGLGGFANRGIN
jgi:hypothetical protein